MENIKEVKIWFLLRIFMGWLMFWPFLDKLFGLGFSTCTDPKTGNFLGVLCKKAWLSGGSPTSGFLTNAVKGPFAGLFKSLAGSPAVDWLFMFGLLLVGLCMLFGIGVRIAGYSGALLVVLMFLAEAVPPANNPLIDEHILYAIIFIGLAMIRAGRFYGLGSWWRQTTLVKKFPILE